MAKDVRAGGAYVELGLKSKVDAGLQAVAKRLRTFGMTAMAIGGGITAAAGAAFGSVMYAANSFANTGDAIGKMAARTGIGVEALQELSFAAGQSGTDIATVEAATRKMSKVVTDSLNGLKGPAESLRAIGIDPQQLAGLSVEQQFQMIAEALGAVDDATRKAALAQQIFGKSGTQLIPMLNSGANGMAALRQEARDLGLVLGATDVSNAEALTDSFARSTRAISALFTKLGAVAATPLIAISDGIAQMVASVHRSIDDIRVVIESIIDVDRLRALVGAFAGVVSRTVGFVKTFVLENQSLVFTLAKVAAVVVAAGAAIGTIGTVALAAGVLVPLLSTGLGILAGVAVKVALPLIGIGAAIAAVGALAWANRERVTAWAMAFWELITPIRTALSSVYQFVLSTFGGIAAAIGAGDFALAADIAVAAVVEAFFFGLSQIRSGWKGLVSIVSSGMQSVGSASASGWSMLSSAAGSAITTAGGYWSAFVAGLVATWQSIRSGAVAAFGAIAQVASETVANLTGAVSRGVANLNPLEGTALSLASTFVGLVSSVVSFVASSAASIVGVVFSIASTIASVGFSIASTLLGIGASIVSTVASVLASIVSTVASVAFSMVSTVVSAVGSAAGFVTALIVAIASRFSTVVSIMVQAWQGFVGFLTSSFATIMSLAQAAWATVQQVPAALISGFGSAYTFIVGGIAAVFGSIAETVSSVIGFITDGMSAMGEFILSTFSGLGAAIASGNFALAGQIAWASIKLAFVAGIGNVKLLWTGFTVGLMEVWGTVSNSIVAVFRGAMGLVAQVMASSIGSLASVAAKVAEYDPSGLTGRLASSLSSVAELSGATADQLVADQNAADQARLAAQVANGQRMIAAEQRVAADIAASRAERDALLAQANEAGGNDLLATARNQRDELIATANANNAGGLFAGLKNQIDSLMQSADQAAAVASPDAVSGAVSMADQALTAGEATRRNIGSFSAVGAALAGMGGGNIQDKIAKASEETRKNTGKMVEKIGDVATNLKNLPQPKFS